MSLKPHPHAEVIKAWADGHTIQVQRPILKDWHDVQCPSWNEELNYRIKPPTKKYRVALGYTGHVMSITSEDSASRVEKTSSFVRWLTDWIEYEA